MECVSLIDISSEDDLLFIPSSWQELGSDETFSNLEDEITENASLETDKIFKLSESPQQKRRRHELFSLRKSLAWDSAFFTSEGVLNHEELAIINCAYSKAVEFTLPGIHEGSNSAESTSSLDGESQPLECLELCLFENLRASAQKPMVDSNQNGNMMSSGKTKLKPPTSLKKHGSIRKKQESSSHDGSVVAKVAASGYKKPSSNKPPKTSSVTPSSVQGKMTALENIQIKSSKSKLLPATGTAAKQHPVISLNKANNKLCPPQPGLKSAASSWLSSNRPGSSSSDSSCSSSLATRKNAAAKPPPVISLNKASTPQPGLKSAASSCLSSSRPASSSSDSSHSSSLATRRNAVGSTAIRSSCNFSRKSPAKITRSRPGSMRDIFDSSSVKPSSLLSKASPSSSICSTPSESSSRTPTASSYFSQNSSALTQPHFGGDCIKSALQFDSGTRRLRMPRPRIGFFDKEKTSLSSLPKSIGTKHISNLHRVSGHPKAAVAEHEFSCNPSVKTRLNLLQPKLFATANGTCVNGEVKSLRPAQQAEVNSVNNGEEKENLSPLFGSERTKVTSLSEDKYCTVTLLEEMVTSLSLSEIKS